MIHLATAYTPGYPWADAYVASLKVNCNVPYTVIQVPPGRNADTRTGMLQHGGFLDRVPDPHEHDEDYADWERDSVIIFTDADMICQRAFTQDELRWMETLYADGQVACGPNKAPGQTLGDEARTLQQIATTHTLDTIFPGWREIPAWNTGWVAARRSTWIRLRDMSRALLPAGEMCFLHYAAVQFVMCYCIGKWLERVDLPYSMHLHGCWPVPDGTTVDAAGLVCYQGEPVAFRHAVNLSPAKGATI